MAPDKKKSKMEEQLPEAHGTTAQRAREARVTSLNCAYFVPNAGLKRRLPKVAESINKNMLE
jgi:hypothetical protein